MGEIRKDAKYGGNGEVRIEVVPVSGATEKLADLNNHVKFMSLEPLHHRIVSCTIFPTVNEIDFAAARSVCFDNLVAVFEIESRSDDLVPLVACIGADTIKFAN